MNKEGSFTIFVGAALAIAGFFFGWFGLSYSGVSFSLSGWELTKLAKQNGVAYYLVYLLPLVAAVVGGLFLLWGVVEVARILYRTTFLGLWLTLAGVLMLFVGGLAGLGRR
mgnify:CR=1 FL=1